MTKATKTAIKTASPKATGKASKKPKLNITKQSKYAEGLSNASVDREACKACGLYKSGEKFRTPMVPDDWSGQVAAVLSGNENSAERRIIKKAYERAGWPAEDVAYVPALRCGNENDPSMQQIRCCRPFLLKALGALKPKYAIAVGDVAMRAVRNNGETNITKNRGKRFTVSVLRDVSPKPGD